MDTTRQNKISRLLQKEMGTFFQQEMNNLFAGTMVSATAVRVSPDLGVARVYLSVFPSSKQQAVMETLQANYKEIRHRIAQITRNQLRKVPDFQYFIDDSLDYAENIDRILGNKLTNEKPEEGAQ